MTRTAADLPWQGPPRPSGLYVHVPFCFHKCHYCDFYSIVDQHDRQGRFVDRLIQETLAFAELTRDSARPLESVFVGGGTPTLLEPDHWARLLDVFRGRLSFSNDVEFTVEANPETVSGPLVEILAREGAGVNRASVGCQSFDPRHLETLERWHEPESVERSVRLLRAGGIDNLNLDLIFAIPGQTLDDWRRDLDRALSLEPDHLSCYGLMYEPGTPLRSRLESGRVAAVDDAVEAAMYETALDTLAAAGFEHYEISAWARPGRRCRHNLVYWTGGDYWPLGPAAAGHVAGVRWRNAPRLEGYLRHGPWPVITDVELPDPDRARREEIMLRLRLREGISGDVLARLRPNAAALARHQAAGLLEHRAGFLRLSPRGLLLADTVIADLMELTADS